MEEDESFGTPAAAGYKGVDIADEVVEKEGTQLIITRGASPSMHTLEQSLNEIQGLYEDKFGRVLMMKLSRRTSLAYLALVMGAGALSSRWNTSAGTDMSYMFASARASTRTLASEM